jgi:hypothetical protein
MKTNILVLMLISCFSLSMAAQSKLKAKTKASVKTGVKTVVKTPTSTTNSAAVLPPAAATKTVSSDMPPIGTWNIKNLEIPTVKGMEVDESAQKQLERALVGSVFTILEDHSCSLKSAFEVNEFDIKKGYWIYDPTAKKMLICDYKDRDEMRPLLLEFTIKQDGNKTFFVLVEEKGTPMIRLAMAKM